MRLNAMFVWLLVTRKKWIMLNVLRIIGEKVVAFEIEWAGPEMRDHSASNAGGPV